MAQSKPEQTKAEEIQQPLTDQQIITTFQNMKTELQAIAEKIGELDLQNDEHR